MPIHDHKDSIEIGESIRIHHFDIRVIMSNEISSEGRDMSVFRPGFCLIILIFQLILFSSRSIETRISRPGPRFRQSITVLGIFKHFKKLTLTKTILKSKSDRPRSFGHAWPVRLCSWCDGGINSSFFSYLFALGSIGTLNMSSKSPLTDYDHCYVRVVLPAQ